VRQEGYREKDAKITAEKEFEDLEKEINVFKTEISKYYRGKVPKKLKDELNNLIIFYHEQREETYDHIIKLLKDD